LTRFWLLAFCFLLFAFWQSSKQLFKLDTLHAELGEWGRTARIAIARHAIARHFLQENNCSTQILSTARIQLILAKPDSSK
jgi:hypothetical protein